MASVIAFDVNETLLDLSVLDPAFEELLGSSTWRGQWFAQMLQLSFVGGLTGEYVDFNTAQNAALRMVAHRAGRSVSPDEASAMVDRMRALPPHPEVRPALQALDTSDLTVVALTNSPLDVGEEQLQHAGIRQYFHRVLSADSVQSLKPAPAPYQSVAAAYALATREVRLVAAHAWDVSGALAAGCLAAFVARGGQIPSPIGRQPDIVGADLAAVVEQILARDLD